MKNLNFRLALSFSLALFAWVIPAYLFNATSYIDNALAPITGKVSSIVLADLELPKYLADDLVQTALLLDNPVVAIYVPWQESLALVLQTQDTFDSAKLALIDFTNSKVEEEVNLAISLTTKEFKSDLALYQNYSLPSINRKLEQTGFALDEASVKLASAFSTIPVEQKDLALASNSPGKVLGSFDAKGLKEKIIQFFNFTNSTPLTFGQTVVEAEQITKHVSFQGKYSNGPVVFLTPMGKVALADDFKYAITNLNEEGFDITLSKASSEAITFNWQVLDSSK